MTLNHLWAGWRATYINDGDAARNVGCVFCELFASDRPAVETLVVYRDERSVALLNAFPYVSGHLLVMPARHVGELHQMNEEESGALWSTMKKAERAINTAYQPEGMNMGFNFGRAGGAGIPQHLHGHVVPRWNGDTNFMTSIANTRVLPETLAQSWQKLTDAWVH